MIESRVVITNQKTGETLTICQGASCKSEDTFARENLFQTDNYNFLPVFADDGELVIFRSKVPSRNDYAELRKSDSPGHVWQRHTFNLVEAEPLEELDSVENIIKATKKCLPLVAQTRIWNDETGLSAMIEYPVKTMNICEETQVYQVDTGPVVFPDLSKKGALKNEMLHIAYIAFNAAHFADFIYEKETSVVVNGKIVAAVPHFSGIVANVPANNRIFAMGTL